MRSRILLVVAAAVLAAVVPSVHAKKHRRSACNVNDCAVVAALGDICDCGTADTHGAYVKCVAHAGKQLAQDDVLPRRCHGKLVSETAGELKAVVKPLIPEGGRIILDVGDVIHVDSSGLGALVALKATAIKQGYCILELDNITPRVLDLLRITNLKQMFMGQAAAN